MKVNSELMVNQTVMVDILTTILHTLVIGVKVYLTEPAGTQLIKKLLPVNNYPINYAPTKIKMTKLRTFNAVVVLLTPTGIKANW